MPPVSIDLHPIEQAKQDLDKKPLRAIDAALSALAQTAKSRADTATKAYLDVLGRAVAYASEVSIPVGEDPVRAIVDTRACDRIACAALLRLLVADDEAFAVDPRLRGATALFDRTLKGSLYPMAGLEVKSQTFEKRDQLRSLVEAHERDLISQVGALRSLSAVGSFRSDLRKLFQTGGTAAFVLPFLPEGIKIQTFEELLSEAQALSECTDASIVNRSEVLKRQCDALKELSDEVGTNYSRKLLWSFADNLQSLVGERVDVAGFADPAQLKIAIRPKRYPFGHAQVPVTVRLDLTNEGPGQAQDISVEVEAGGAISFDDTVRNVGLLGPTERQIDFHGLVANSSGGCRAIDDSDVLGVKVTWRNPDGSEQVLEELFPLKPQKADVPWGELELARPYQLEPIRELKDFVGRSASIRDLVRVVLQSENARIEGEKRVGKTSLAYAVDAAVGEYEADKHLFIHLESGDFNSHTLEATIERLGQMIVEQVQESDPRLASIPMPDFSPGLTTLTEFFKRAYNLVPDIHFVVVLDEFDALPHSALYKHEPVGEAFFQTLRSLGGKQNVTFILIGAERMQWVFATHGQSLNKFKLVRLDYFASDQLSDYAELVRAPVAEWLYFSEEAIDLLYAETAGNPWMTKLLLIELFERQVERRDQDVQIDDVHDAIEHALPGFDATYFQHFWDDAIQGEVEERDHVSAIRRRVLLALARRLQSRGSVSEDELAQEALSFNVDEPSAREVIRGFVDRRILIKEEGALVCRVPLFERWLARYGTHEIILGSGDDDVLIRRQRAIEEMRPKAEEIEELAFEWKSYRGREVRPDQILRWLEQFGGPEEQRQIMPILKGLRFYTTSKINEKLREVHQYLVRELASRGYQYTRSGQQRNRNDLLVCGLEGGGSGAAHLLKQYRQENGIYRDCVIADPANVRSALENPKRTYRAVVLVEDFMGTGTTAASRLQELHDLWIADGGWPPSVEVFLLGITAFDGAVKKVERKLDKLKWPVTIRVADLLGEEDRCFHSGSGFYPDLNDREKAQTLCSRFGGLLTAKTPLGYGNTEAAVCFEYRCPNNTLPVLWCRGDDWKPLFPRND